MPITKLPMTEVFLDMWPPIKDYESHISLVNDSARAYESYSEVGVNCLPDKCN